MQQGTLQPEQFSLLMAHHLNHLFHPFPPVFNNMIIATVSTMDAMTVVAIYSTYVWPDVVIQTIQSTMALPSIELSIEGDVPGGIAVWLVVAFALVTYAFVYHQYPTHEDWVANVLSIVLPFLSQWLWKSD